MARVGDARDGANPVLCPASDESRFIEGAGPRIDDAQLISSL